MSSPERSRPLGFMKTHPDELATLFSEASVAYASTSRVGGWAVGDARGGSEHLILGGSGPECEYLGCFHVKLLSMNWECGESWRLSVWGSESKSGATLTSVNPFFCRLWD